MPAGRIFVTRPILEEGIELLCGSGATLRVGQADGNAPIERAALLDGVRQADVLVSHLSETIDREVLGANPALRGVATYAVGYNNIDIKAANELGIPVSNTPDVLTDATADLTWALLLAVARHIPAAHRFTVEGHFAIWNPVLFLGADVGPGGSGRRKVLGIIGFGRIGQAVARRGQGFEMEILAHDPSKREEITANPDVAWAEIDELLERSDFVSLHAPLTEKTRHLIGTPELQAMKPSAYLINAARGPIVDEKALVRALREDWIAGAALDVYENEPQLAPGLAELPNVVLAPHIGSAARETRAAMARIVARNAIAHLHGEPAPEVVNGEVYAGTAWRSRRKAWQDADG